jgi:catechol 2,3-dioxygenase-like lactoylglutathione lyase family enzyme
MVPVSKTNRREGVVEKLINGLIGQYEKGALSRRELVGTLAALSMTGKTAFAAEAGFQSASINHVSITASDLQRSVDFYSRVFKLTRQPRPAANLVQLTVGTDSHLSIRQGANPRFDHFAIGIEGFNKDRVIADLKARGATPIDGGDGAGLHLADPDGLFIQVIGNGGAG